MKLQKRELPLFETTLPFSLRSVKYRAYTVKEEKILTMAATSKVEGDIYSAIKQIVENCTSVNIEELAEVDFEFLFLKLIAASVSSIAKVNITVDCESEGCPGVHETAINLDHVTIAGIDELKESGFIQKRDTWVIPFDADSGMTVRLVLGKGNEWEDIHQSTVNIFEGESVYDEFTKEELQEYLEDLPSNMFDRIDEFFKKQPYCTARAEAKCAKCKRDITVDLRGILDFLE